ncbi:MAG TPA: MoxR family ATPase [Pyrinomonadaceae bacterium]
MKQQPFPDRPPLDPTVYVREHGARGLADILRVKGRYIIQARPLKALEKALRRRKPLLLEGEPGSGKTALALGLIRAFNLPSSRLQCMSGLRVEKVLYRWQEAAQDQHVRQQTEAGVDLEVAQAGTWQRPFLKLGPALEPFDYAARNPFKPLALYDEIDKLDEEGEDLFLQLLQDGYADVPGLMPDPRVGVVEDRGEWPVVILTSNNMRSGVSSPLRSRCYYTYIKSATPEEEVYILSACAPGASAFLLAQTVKLMRYVGSMGGVRDKPALRESIDFLNTLVDEGAENLTRELIEENLCALAKRQTDLEEMGNGVAAMKRAIDKENIQIETWAREACSATQHYASQVEGV